MEHLDRAYLDFMHASCHFEGELKFLHLMMSDNARKLPQGEAATSREAAELKTKSYRVVKSANEPRGKL